MEKYKGVYYMLVKLLIVIPSNNNYNGNGNTNSITSYTTHPIP